MRIPIKCFSSKASNHYDILGVSNKASSQEIRQAFLRLSKQHHPDRKSGDQLQFQRLNEAYTVLSREDTRQRYDVSLQRPSIIPYNAEEMYRYDQKDFYNTRHTHPDMDRDWNRQYEHTKRKLDQKYWRDSKRLLLIAFYTYVICLVGFSTLLKRNRENYAWEEFDEATQSGKDGEIKMVSVRQRSFVNADNSELFSKKKQKKD